MWNKYAFEVELFRSFNLKIEVLDCIQIALDAAGVHDMRGIIMRDGGDTFTKTLIQLCFNYIFIKNIWYADNRKQTKFAVFHNDVNLRPRHSHRTTFIVNESVNVLLTIKSQKYPWFSAFFLQQNRKKFYIPFDLIQFQTQSLHSCLLLQR